LEKSRGDWRIDNGSVGVGTGADGNTEAALFVVVVGVSWAYPAGMPVANMSAAAAMARSVLPDFLLLCRTSTSCCSNTRKSNECMISLHEWLGHVGCHSSRRQENLSGRTM
jgi:hypothetical protein